MKDISHVEAMAKLFRADPDYAAELLVHVIHHGKMEEVIVVLKYVEFAFSDYEHRKGSGSDD